MLRRPPALLVPALLAVACGSSTNNLTCPTTAQSATFDAAGSCGGAVTGTVTISTEPGLCAITVKGGNIVKIPTSGQFSGTASQPGQGGYDLTKGNWTLTISQGNAAAGSLDVNCDTSVTASTGQVDLSCSTTSCPPDDGTGVTCNSGSCVEHLTPKK